MTVVIAAGGYPERGDSGSPITGIEEAEALGALVFHAGTALRDDAARDERRPDPRRDRASATIVERARALAYEAAAQISFDGARYRRDIAQPEASRVG